MVVQFCWSFQILALRVRPTCGQVFRSRSSEGRLFKTTKPDRSKCRTMRFAATEAVMRSESWTRFRPLNKSAKATDSAMSAGVGLAGALVGVGHLWTIPECMGQSKNTAVISIMGANLDAHGLDDDQVLPKPPSLRLAPHPVCGRVLLEHQSSIPQYLCRSPRFLCPRSRFSSL